MASRWVSSWLTVLVTTEGSLAKPLAPGPSGNGPSFHPGTHLIFVEGINDRTRLRVHSTQYQLGAQTTPVSPLSQCIAVPPTPIYLGYTDRETIKVAPCFQGVSSLIYCWETVLTSLKCVSHSRISFV